MCQGPPDAPLARASFFDTFQKGVKVLLFLLTGEIQTGKTRWLQALLSHLEGQGVTACGVIAPGIWQEGSGGHGASCLEKVGIENVLLPVNEVVPFATRRDLIDGREAGARKSQSARAGLGWEIADKALARVNDYLLSLQASSFQQRGERVGRLLIIDEVGPLELCRKEGLTAAVSLLEQGSSACFSHAVAVVRPSLLEKAQARFGEAWGGCCVIRPDDESRKVLLSFLQSVSMYP